MARFSPYGRAHKWSFGLLRLPVDKQPAFITTWYYEDFIKELQKREGVSVLKAAARLKWQNICQITSVAVYYAEFYKLASELKYIDEEVQLKDKFVIGLKDPIRIEIIKSKTTAQLDALTLAELADLAIGLDINQQMARRELSQTFFPPYQQRQQVQTPVQDPYAMEIDATTTMPAPPSSPNAARGGFFRGNGRGRGRGRGQPRLTNPPPPPHNSSTTQQSSSQHVEFISQTEHN